MLPKRMTVTQVREAREGHPRLHLQQVIFFCEQSRGEIHQKLNSTILVFNWHFSNKKLC